MFELSEINRMTAPRQGSTWGYMRTKCVFNSLEAKRIIYLLFCRQKSRGKVQVVPTPRTNRML